MYSKFGQFIHGKWQPSEKNETYDVINPATEDVIGKASKATKVDVTKALKSAEEGFKVWKKTPPWQRSCLLYTSPSPRDISGSRMPSSA